MATTNCPVRIEWRVDGQYGYRDTDLAEIRSGRITARPNTALTADTPRGRVILGDYLVYDTDGYRIISDDNPIALFLRTADRACR